MRATLLLTAMIAAASSGHAASLPEQLAPAAQGKLECARPDMVRGTCLSLDTYKIAEDGTIDDVSVMLISNHPTITMEVVTPVGIKDGQVCETLRQPNVDALKFLAEGYELDAHQAQPFRQKAAAILKDIMGHELCATYIPDGRTIVAKVKMDGIRTPVMDERLLWVSRDEGYTLAP